MSSEMSVELLMKKLCREKEKTRVLESQIENHSRELYSTLKYSQSIINSMPDLLTVCDKDGLIKMSNIPFDKLVGKKANDFNILDFFSNQEIFMNSSCEGKILGKKYIAEKNRFSKEDWIVVFKNIQEYEEKEEIKRKLQDEMIRNAYSEGITENSISILHNIGNILTPISLKSNTNTLFEEVKILNLLLESLSGKIKNGDNQTEILKILNFFMEKNEEFHTLIISNFNFIHRNVLHIAEVIQSQQKYANKERLIQEISFESLLNDVLLIQEDLISSKDINIRLFVQDFKIEIEKVGFHQTLSNFIVNSIDSLDIYSSGERFIEISSFVNYVNKNIEIEIKDNGVGIDSKTLSKIYDFGFSTKERSSGFGLHSCSNFIKKNNGELEILSEGLNKGATVRICFPIS